MAQGNALLHVNSDGTVMLSHDGIELGQGINVKMAQICAEELNIPVEDIYCPQVSTQQTTGMVGMGLLLFFFYLFFFFLFIFIYFYFFTLFFFFNRWVQGYFESWSCR